MSTNTFIPIVWSARLLDTLVKAHVYGALVNRDYEGEIKEKGNTVKINTIGEITIGDYEKDDDIAAAEKVTGTDQSLVIDQGKYFNFQIDDVDKAQQTPKLMPQSQN